MLKIFISYRHRDTKWQSTMIYECLRERFGKKSVFMDVITIPAGVDFREYLHNAIRGFSVLLAVIGERWLVDRDGNRWLDKPGDFVRIEIEAALGLGIRVIPVLVDETKMPDPDELPESIRDFAFRHAVRVRSGRDFRNDVRRLIQELEAPPADEDSIEERSSGPRPDRGSSSPPPLPCRAIPGPPADEDSVEERLSEPRPDRGSSSPPPLPSRAISGPPAKTVTLRPRSPLQRAGEVITNSLGTRLAFVPAGEFLMGSPDSDNDAHKNEKPQHRVRITRPFYLGVHPVTQEEYERVMGNNPSQFKGDPQRPVESVSWNDAMEFCRQLSEKEGKEYRLPIEAEWEYACRAGSRTEWCFGDSESQLAGYAWYFDNSDHTTHPVGQKKPNGWGLYDMHGNVWEWCSDWYVRDYYENSSANDPQGPSSGSHRVIRGGSWNTVACYSRSANRFDYSPGNRSGILGFRVCLAWTDDSCLAKVRQR